MEDSLKITENSDGTFAMEWDKEDPNWKWLNSLTSKEIQVIMEQAIKEELQRRD
jgi:hypothetical protein